MTHLSKIIIIGIVLLSTAGLILLTASILKHREKLPVLGEPGHVTGAFSFTNQNGKTITEKDITGDITVVEYFFTSCQGICKVMNKNLLLVQEAYGSNPRVMMLSHTVDPETDSVPVLQQHAQKLGATAANWQFLTGDKPALYRMARQDYLLAVADSTANGDKDDFIHTEQVTLLDGRRRIRGFYDATNRKAIEKLVADINILLKEGEN